MQIKLRCPLCGKNKNIDLTDEFKFNTNRGIIAINITKNIVCEHTFIVYIDQNSEVRDYFIADFQIDLPNINFEEIQENKKPTSHEKLDIDLIKLTVPALLLVNILKGIISKKKVLIIFDMEFLNSFLINFFDYICENSFQKQIQPVLEKNYIENKKNYKDYIVLQGNQILNDNQNILNIKKLQIEKRIIHQFLIESNNQVALIFIKNEVQKAYELSKYLANFLKETNNYDITFITENLQKYFNVKISSVYLRFLLNIVEYYFEIEIPKSIKFLFKVLF